MLDLAGQAEKFVWGFIGNFIPKKYCETLKEGLTAAKENIPS